MNTITLNCNAKINLSLDAIAKRKDGYHDLELIFLEIPIYDTITVSLRNDGEIHLSCDDKTLPTDERNIAYKAAVTFFAEIGTNHGADIDIKKQIPHGAGLAGGSADAAGVLKALNSLTGNPLDTDNLLKLGVKLGADVPFCILGGCAFAEGVGEILTPLPMPPKMYYVITKPEESISTAFVFKNLNLDNRPDSLCVHAVAEGIRRGDIDMIVKNSGNILESVTIKEVPIINDIKKSFIENGAILSLMSGSGTSVFGAFETEAAANVAAKAVEKYANKIFIVG